MKFLPGIDDFFDHFTQLIHLDRKDAAVNAAVTELRDGVLEGAIDGGDAVAQQVLKPDNEREGKAAGTGLVYHLENINGAAAFLQRARFHVAVGVDREISAAPSIHIVC